MQPAVSWMLAHTLERGCAQLADATALSATPSRSSLMLSCSNGPNNVAAEYAALALHVIALGGD